MARRTIERYRIRAVLFHWAHAGAFLVLVLTGSIMFLPLGDRVTGGESIHVLHRAAAVIFIGLPIAYSLFEPRSPFHFIKETLRWGKDDLKWLKAAPAYYFGGPEEKMPPQDRMNTGQKLWQGVIVGTGIVFLASGSMLWFYRGSLALDVYEWTRVAHDLAFLVVFVMFLIHVYMGFLHPRMGESLFSMLNGKISPAYARSHHRKWFDTLSDKSRE